MHSSMSTSDGRRVNPYVGPAPFETGRPLYGRAHETDALLSLLAAQPVVLLHSPSGAGKTSLIQAALVPRLRKLGFAGISIARVGRNGLAPTPAFSRPVNRYV